MEINSFNNEFKSIPLASNIMQVQPMTGIVYWKDNWNEEYDPKLVQMEFSYIYYGDVVSRKGEYNWTGVEKILTEIQSRSHQAILRFTDISGNKKETDVPTYIKDLPDYQETKKEVDGKNIWLSDWSNSELKRFILDFYKEFATRYDDDKRIAFLEVGFGIWAEYHLTPNIPDIGTNFPDKEFQKDFINQLNNYFKKTFWLISLDAAKDWTPFATQPNLLKIPFGIFDDSFMQKDYKEEKDQWWNVFGFERWKLVPIGGEFSNDSYNRKELYSGKIHESSFNELTEIYHPSFIIARSDTFCDRNKHSEKKCQDENYQDGSFQESDIINASLNTGYKFKILKFEANSTISRITVKNIGTAPIYYDAWLAVNKVRAISSLKGLLPNEEKTFEIDSGGVKPNLKIESDRILPEQEIQFEANLN